MLIEIPDIGKGTHKVDCLLRIMSGDLNNKQVRIECYCGSIQVWRNVHISVHDIEEISILIQKKVEAISDAPKESDWSDLRDLGSYAFNHVFDDEILKDSLLSILNSNDKTISCIQVVSDDVFLPWEFLCEDPESTNNSAFWGSRFLIQRTIPVTRRCEFNSPELLFKKIPQIGLVTDKSLFHVSEVEVPYFDRLENDATCKVLKLRELDPSPDLRRQEVQELRRFFQQEFNVAHFACHAVFKRDEPSSSSFRFTNNFNLPIRDFETHEIESNGSPFVFLNSCNTGNNSPNFTSQIVKTIMFFGARGVVSSEFRLRDDLAAKFACHFYDCLLSGYDVGSSLMSARLYLFDKCDSPIGLTYTLYSRPNIRLRRDGNGT